MLPLSVVIITYNEEKNIGRCLDSVKEIADDIVVVDSFSKDETENICKAKGVRFVQHKFDGHIEQKNWAIPQAKFPHILSLDADEALSDELNKSILAVKNNWTKNGYYMNRLTNYCGKWIHHCGWYPDKKLRLWDSRKGKWGGINPHDKYDMFEGDKVTGFLKGDILHYSFYSVEDHVKQVEYFTDISAKALFEKKMNSTFVKRFFSPVAKFLKDYFFKLGFLDGYYGFTISRISAKATFLKYYKLKKLNQEIRTLNFEPFLMNILHLSTALSWRGGEQQIAYLVDELKKYHVNQWVVCSENSAMKNYCSKNNITFLTFKKIFFSSIFNAYKLKRICRQLNIQFVHLHDAHAHATAVLSATLFGNKTSFILSRRVDFPIKNNWFSKYKYNHSNIKKIICVSDAIRKILVPDIKNKSLLTVVYDGVDTNRFNTTSKEILRKTFSVSHDELIIGNVAAIAPHKDYFTFVDTVEILVQQKLKAKFFIIGDGSERKKIEQYIADQNLQQHIFLTGFRKDIADIFPELDMLLFTSKTEGLGSSVLDAYSCKVPVVATNAGGISEIVINEKTGLLSPVKEAVHLAKNILRLIQDEQLRKEVIKHGTELLKRFTKEEMGKQTFQIYEEALPKSLYTDFSH